MKKKTNNNRPELRIVANYMMVDGEEVRIDPAQTNLPDRCKLAWAEISTGQPHEIVEEVIKKASGG